jgi:hypothetical protein
MKILMLFLDGVGIGTEDPSVNPFFRANLPSFRSLFDDVMPSLKMQFHLNGRAAFLPLDPTLGVDGLPQSGTGQTALFTGVNAPQLIGKHFGPYPYSTLRPILREKNLFRQLTEAGKSVYFANAYPQRFFDYFSDKHTRLTVTTLSCSYCNMPLHRVEELRAGKAISADITNAAWPRMGYPDIAPIQPAEAGRRLARLSAEYDFVLFEYWRTDKAGHSEKMEEAVEVLEQLDGMLSGVLHHLAANDTLLLITSDHGNIEDMSSKVHTRNPVPVFLFGHRHQEVAEALRQQPDLTAVTPAIVRSMNTIVRESIMS